MFAQQCPQFITWIAEDEEALPLNEAYAAIVGQLPNESSAVIIFERPDRDRNYVAREGADALLALDQQSRPEILSIAVEEIEQEEAVLRDQRAASRYAGRRRPALRALSAASRTVQLSPEIASGAESLLTLCWRKPDSNHWDRRPSSRGTEKYPEIPDLG